MTQGTRTIKSLLKNNIILFLIVPLIVPQGLNLLSPALYTILNYAKYLSVALIVLAFVVTAFYRRRIDTPCVVAILFPLMGLVATVITGEGLDGWTTRYLIILVAALLVSVYKNDLVRLIRITRLYLELLVLINLFFVLRYPTGWYETDVYKYSNWFLGYKSSLQCYVMPLVCFAWIESSYSGRRLHFFLIMALCFVEALLCGNMMLTVGLIIIIVFYLTRLYKKTKVMNGITYFTANAVFNFLFVGLNQIITHLGWMQSFLIALGKTDAISGRTTVLWPKALRMIGERPLFGYGVYPGERYANIFGSRTMPHAHNQFLQVLLDGGLVLLFFYALWMIYSAKKLTNNKDLKSSQVVALCSFIIFVMVTVEIIMNGIVYFATWVILFLGSYTQELDKQYSRISEKPRLIRRG